MTDGQLMDSVVIDLEVLDTTVRLHCVGAGAASVAEAVRRAWVRCLRADVESPDVSLRLATDSTLPGVDVLGEDITTLLHHLSSRVTVRAIQHQAGRLLMLHAAGLAVVDSGRAAALVAPSGTGKTTAAARLARELGYLSDETVGVRTDGSIAPYPKPLSLVVADHAPVKQQVSPSDLDLVVAPQSCYLSAIVLLARDSRSEAWVEDVSLLHALARLGPETSYLSRLDRPLHRLADTVQLAGGLKVLHYADSNQLPTVLADLLVAS
jgi:hypothetical protein